MNQRASALRDAMINEEEPSVAREELGEELEFLRESFNYQVSGDNLLYGSELGSSDMFLSRILTVSLQE